MFDQYAAYNTGNSEILTSDCPDNVRDTFVHLCINMQGLAPVGWKIVQAGFSIFFTSSSVIVFLLSGRDEDSLWGATSFKSPEMRFKYEPLAITISSISFLLILYGFVFFLSMLSITMIYTLIPCDNRAFCKEDVPDGGLSSYAAKNKRGREYLVNYSYIDINSQCQQKTWQMAVPRGYLDSPRCC